ncbi:MAG: BREX-3 system phosphatase PglZ [Polyangiaceae bacterium]|nr:BREX-3 system phosphatase PglZ [Polyangiaceae bacterium]
MDSGSTGRTAGWRDEILKEFTPQVAHLTLVADPDALLLEAGILKGIEERGFELIPFEDHVAFRFAYESRYRSRWDRGGLTDLVVVLRAAASDLRSLPYDLLQAGRRLSFNLGDLFPHLSYPVIDALDRSDLDDLYKAQQREKPDRPLGDRQTKGFVLRHVFGVAPETIQQESDLVRFLLRRHYRCLRIPPVLDRYLIERLGQNVVFSTWPLERIVADREAFFAFLQERWPIFLDRQAAQAHPVREPGETYGMEFSGPAEIPFDHHDVRVYIDNLFLEGVLQPISHPQADKLAGSWVIVGVKTEPKADRKRRLSGLLEAVEQSIPCEAAPHQNWLTFAQRWAQVNALWFDPDGQEAGEREDELLGVRERIDEAFTSWLRQRFGTLHNQPPSPPVMPHHVPRLLARRLEESRNGKVALVLMDGLALDQWVVVQRVLSEQRPGLRFREGGLFAWIPSLTMVSRQACFAGRPPLYFPSSIHTTDREPSGWQRFWADEGLSAAEVGYEKNLREQPDLARVEELVSHPKLRAAGLVVDKIDRIMHGMTLGSRGMHNLVRQWAKQGVLAALLDILLERGFAIFLTADHGNIETKGCGRPAEGSVADLRGERVRIYPDPALRAKVKTRFPDAIEWPSIGLPDDYLALIAADRLAFVRETDSPVAHGGVTLEEVVVPLVEIERK